MDIFSAEKRSEIMSRIRSTGTNPELRLTEIVRAILGQRRRIHQNASWLPGQPDVLIPSLDLAIFADGCFYHSCPKHGHLPESNQHYWAAKFERTLVRDRRNRQKLRRLGYAVWRVWEHDLKGANAERAYRLLEAKLSHRTDSMKEPA